MVGPTFRPGAGRDHLNNNQWVCRVGMVTVQVRTQSCFHVIRQVSMSRLASIPEPSPRSVPGHRLRL